MWQRQNVYFAVFLVYLTARPLVILVGDKEYNNNRLRQSS